MSIAKISIIILASFAIFSHNSSVLDIIIKNSSTDGFLIVTVMFHSLTEIVFVINSFKSTMSFFASIVWESKE